MSRPQHSKPSTISPTPPPRDRKGIYIASGLLLYTLTTYSVYLITTLHSSSSHSLPFQDSDVSTRYDSTASHFDADVTFIERVSGINRRRKRLVSQAEGDVLEVCAGTGRNSVWYDFAKVKSIVFVDQSGPMVEIAKQKWQALHPNYEKAAFHKRSIMDPLPISKTMPNTNFTTIIQTMGLCSTPDPSTALAHLATLAHPTTGRILLLEHGRSYYKWVNYILDKSAARHADKHGCWYNRDIEEVLQKSGLRVDKVERSQFGTVWLVEARPAAQIDVESTNALGSKEEIKTQHSPQKGWLEWPKR